MSIDHDFDWDNYLEIARLAEEAANKPPDKNGPFWRLFFESIVLPLYAGDYRFPVKVSLTAPDGTTVHFEVMNYDNDPELAENDEELESAVETEARFISADPPKGRLAFPMEISGVDRNGKTYTGVLAFPDSKDA